MKNTICFFFSMILMLSACKEKASNDTNNKEESPVMIKTKYTLTPFDPSPSYASAHLSDMRYEKGTFGFEVNGYELGQQTSDAASKMCANSGKGQHIHLIVNDAPYAAKYVSDFEHPVDDGAHHILAFLSRSYHESIKTESTHIAQKVNVKGGAITSSENIKDPMVFYSRPKGTYVGDDAKKVMLDFYLVNTTIGGDYYIDANINGEIHKIEKWQPYYIEGLGMGDNYVSLALKNKDGSLVPSPLNPVKRIFTLKEDLPAKN